MLHETIESNEGRVEFLRTGFSAKTSDINPKSYEVAHVPANAFGATQSGPVFEEPRDANGNLVPKSGPSRVLINYVIDDGVQSPVIIKTNC